MKEKFLKMVGLEETDLTQDFLDELVYEYKAEEASIINNSGQMAQIEYLLGEL